MQILLKRASGFIVSISAAGLVRAGHTIICLVHDGGRVPVGAGGPFRILPNVFAGVLNRRGRILAFASLGMGGS